MSEKAKQWLHKFANFVASILTNIHTRLNMPFKHLNDTPKIVRKVTSQTIRQNKIIPKSIKKTASFINGFIEHFSCFFLFKIKAKKTKKEVKKGR